MIAGLLLRAKQATTFLWLSTGTRAYDGTCKSINNARSCANLKKNNQEAETDPYKTPTAHGVAVTPAVRFS